MLTGRWVCLADYVLALEAEIRTLKHKFQTLEGQLGDVLGPLPADAQPPAQATSDAAGEAPARRPAPRLCSTLSRGTSRRPRSAGTPLRGPTPPGPATLPAPALPRGCRCRTAEFLVCVLWSYTVLAGHAGLLSRHERLPTSRQQP